MATYVLLIVIAVVPVVALVVFHRLCEAGEEADRLTRERFGL